MLTCGVICPAEYLGGAITCDAYHMTDPRADGLGVSTCIDLALKDSRIDRDQVGVGVQRHTTVSPFVLPCWSLNNCSYPAACALSASPSRPADVPVTPLSAADMLCR